MAVLEHSRSDVDLRFAIERMFTGAMTERTSLRTAEAPGSPGAKPAHGLAPFGSWRRKTQGSPLRHGEGCLPDSETNGPTRPAIGKDDRRLGAARSNSCCHPGGFRPGEACTVELRRMLCTAGRVTPRSLAAALRLPWCRTRALATISLLKIRSESLRLI